MEAQLMSQFPPKKGPLSEGEIGTPAHGEGSHTDSQKGNAIYVFLKKYIHIYKFMYIYTLLVLTDTYAVKHVTSEAVMA